MQDIQSLIRQARDENWEELDLSGMGLTELPMAYGRSETIEVCALTELKTLIFREGGARGMEGWRV